MFRISRRRFICRINNTKARLTAAAMPPPSAPLPALPPSANATLPAKLGSGGLSLAAPIELGYGGGGGSWPAHVERERVPLVDIDVDMRDN
jgi:hypothetical protein